MGPGGPPGLGGLRRGPGGRPRGKYAPRRKVCFFTVNKISYIDYKDLMLLRRYLSDRGKIEPRRKTGTSAKYQRQLAQALKRARHLALLPYTGEHLRMLGGIIQPIPGYQSAADRPFPPRDSFGPGGSQPGGSRPPPPRDGGRMDGPPPDGAPSPMVATAARDGGRTDGPPSDAAPAPAAAPTATAAPVAAADAPAAEDTAAV